MLLRYSFYVIKWGHCSVFSLICFDKYPVWPSLLSRCGMFLSPKKDLHSPSRQCSLLRLRQALSYSVITVFVSSAHSRIPAAWNHTICLFGGCHLSPTVLCVSVVFFFYWWVEGSLLWSFFWKLKCNWYIVLRFWCTSMIQLYIHTFSYCFPLWFITGYYRI